jgi:GNAT superfamily N-acetyltransferase
MPAKSVKINLAPKRRHDEGLDLHRLNIRGITALVAQAPGFSARITPDCGLILTGEPAADLNLLLVGPDADPKGFLKDAAATARERELPVVALFTPHVAAILAPSARKLGLAFSGTMPLMLLRSIPRGRTHKACRVERALDKWTSARAGDLQARAFELPRDSVARVFDSSRDKISQAETYIGVRGGEVLSAVTVVRFGSTAGIWTMATAPERQRQGIGRALLTDVLEQYRRQGVSRFFLVASAAGKPLYESVGFKVVARYSVWVMD